MYPPASLCKTVGGISPLRIQPQWALLCFVLSVGTSDPLVTHPQSYFFVAVVVIEEREPAAATNRPVIMDAV